MLSNYHLQALECGFKRIKKSDLESALSACVKNNETLHSILEMTLSSTVSPSIEQHSNSKEDNAAPRNQSEEKGNKLQTFNNEVITLTYATSEK